MSPSKDKGFRQRVDEPEDDRDAGLSYKSASNPDPPIDGLILDSPTVIPRLEGLLDPRIGLDGVADRIQPANHSGLSINADFGKLGESVRRIHEQEKSNQIAALLQKAQDLLAKEKFGEAMAVLDAALRQEPNNTNALFLKAFCHFCLKQFSLAAQVLNQASKSSPAPPLAILILLLKGVCERALTQEIEQNLKKLLDQKKHSEALRFVEAELAKRPSDPALHYFRCTVLLIMDRLQDAQRAIDTAERVAGPGNASLFSDIKKKLHFAESRRNVEAARISLRRGNPHEAKDHLELCRSAMAGHKEYEEICAYARDRAGRGALKSLFGGSKTTLTSDGLQRVLGWLLSDELNKGIESLKNKKWSEAASQFESASQIDSRCGLAHFLQARALFEKFGQSLNGSLANRDLEKDLTTVRYIRKILDSAVVDGNLKDQIKDFTGNLDNILSQIQLASKANPDIKLVNEYITKFNDLMEELKQDPINSAPRFLEAINRLSQIRDSASSARSRVRGSEGKNRLDKLIGAIDEMLNAFMKGR